MPVLGLYILIRLLHDLLKDWQLHLTEMMTATDENMSGPQSEGQLAEQFRHVSGALSNLERESPETPDSRVR